MKRKVTSLLAGIVLLTPAPGAAGHEKSFKSRVTIKGDDTFTEYRGRVFSGAQGCVRHRTVILYQKLDGPDENLGEDKTNYDGDWWVPLPEPGAGYYAKVKRRVVTKPGHRHVCRGDRSPVDRPY